MTTSVTTNFKSASSNKADALKIWSNCRTWQLL